MHKDNAAVYKTMFEIIIRLYFMHYVQFVKPMFYLVSC